MSIIILKAFQALQGDSLVLSYRSSTELLTNVVIDAGFASTYHRTLSPFINEIISKGEKLNLVIISHFDNDHITGFIPLFLEHSIDLIDTVWFNHFPESFGFPSIEEAIGVKEGIQIRDFLLKASKISPDRVYAPQCHFLNGGLFKVLSPRLADLDALLLQWDKKESELESYPMPISSGTDDKHLSIEELAPQVSKKDNSLSNRSSISTLFTFEGKSILFTADASPESLVDSLINSGFSQTSPANLSLMQVPHHGSSKNISFDLLDLIDCNNFLISSNATNTYDFPHKTTLAKIVISVSKKRPGQEINFFFNYDHPTLRAIFTDEELHKYNINCVFPNSDENGITITF